MTTSPQGWMPIETAPKDGTRVDLWYPRIGRRIDCYFRGAPFNCWGWDEPDPEGVDGETYFVVLGSVEPTHWQPLPAPPVSA